MRQSRRATNLRSKGWVFVLVMLCGSLMFADPAQAQVRPDFCSAINPGTADVEVSFLPSKLNLIGGTDDADYYEIVRSDGRTWRIETNEPKNIHDLTTAGVERTYQAFTINDAGNRSNPTNCTPYDAVSSISPGRHRDWRRPAALVTHALGEDPLATSYRDFDGEDGDFVQSVVGQAESDRLNPAGGQFAYQAAILLTPAQLDELIAYRVAQGLSPSWNVMQRGFADAPGGQWKMSLTVTADGVPRAQCRMRDGNGVWSPPANSTFELVADRRMTITCVIDDEANTIRVIVNGRTDAEAQTPAGFADVAPEHFGDGCSRSFAQTITVGNKPLCNTTLTDDDRFQGRIFLARVLKG